MRTVYLILVVVFFNTTAFASEIREFDIKTLEKLGNELTRVSQQSDRGATTPFRHDPVSVLLSFKPQRLRVFARDFCDKRQAKVLHAKARRRKEDT
jgi:hypothetical protein